MLSEQPFVGDPCITFDLFKMPIMVVISESFPLTPPWEWSNYFPLCRLQNHYCPFDWAGLAGTQALLRLPSHMHEVTQGQKHIFKWGLGWTVFPFEPNPESILLPRLLSWPAADLDTFPSSCGSNVTRRGTHRTTWSPDSWASPLMYIYQYIT